MDILLSTAYPKARQASMQPYHSIDGGERTIEAVCRQIRLRTANYGWESHERPYVPGLVMLTESTS